MTDDDLSKALSAAHRSDAPPPFATFRARVPARPHPRRRWLAVAGLAAAALVAALLWPRPPAVARLDVASPAPLDFLLDVPGTDLLRATPRFDLKGTLP